LLQPIVCRPKGSGYECLAGARRVAAHVLLQRPTILAIVRELPGDPTIAHIGHQLELSAGDASFRLPVAADVDAAPVTAPAVLSELDGAELARILATVAPSVAQEDTRIGINGVHLASEDGRLTAVATDGHRMALASMETPARVEVPPHSLLSRRAVRAIAKLAAGPVRFGFSEPNTAGTVSAWLATPDETLRFSAIYGEFPDYTAVLPKGQATLVSVDTAALRAALRRMSLVVTRTDRAIAITIADGRLSMAARSAEGARAEDSIPAAIDGPGIKIGLNPGYLAESITWAGARVELGFAKLPVLPVRVTSPGVDGTLAVIMPMRLD
jgi:DNA polymerase-3 subunit beta